MSKKPFFSIVMSVYNGEGYIDQCLQSILGQSFIDFECIVIDDASVDNSLKLLQKYDDKRIRIIKNKKNLGLTRSLNKGIKEAKGKYIARIDIDDWWDRNKLKEQYNFLRENPKYGIVGTNGWNVNEKGKVEKEIIRPRTDKEIKKYLIKKCPLIHSSIVMNKWLINKYGSYDPSFRCSQDYELWLRLSDKTKYYNLQKLLVYKRTFDNNMSALKWKQMLKEGIRARLYYYKKFNVSWYTYLFLFGYFVKLLLPVKAKLWKRKFSKKIKLLFKS